MIAQHIIVKHLMRESSDWRFCSLLNPSSLADRVFNIANKEWNLESEFLPSCNWAQVMGTSRTHQVVTIDGTDDQCSFWIHHDIHVFPQSICLHTHTPARTHTHAVILRRLLKCNRLDRIKRTLVPRSTIPTCVWSVHFAHGFTAQRKPQNIHSDDGVK